MNATVIDLTIDKLEDFNTNTIKSDAIETLDLTEDSNDINSLKQVKLDSLIEASHTINIAYPVEYYGDLLQIHEFLNKHLEFLGLRTTFPNGMTMEHIESAIIHRHNAKLYQLMFIFLTTLFKYHSIESVERGYQRANKYLRNHPRTLGHFANRLIDRIYDCDVSELPCDEFTISEVLRLHLLRPSVLLKKKDISDEMLNQYVARQNVALGFIKKHPTIIQSLHHDTIYRLSSGDLLKIFICLLYQILTFGALRIKIEENSSSNYLGCDESNRKYWRLDSMPGIYVECINEWKHINSIENLSLLMEVVQDPTLKHNLLKHEDKIVGDIFKRRNQNMINNYRLTNFNSFEDWHQLWEQKFSTFQDLIDKYKLVCDKPKVDFNFFQNSFSKCEIPIINVAMTNCSSMFQSIKLRFNSKDNIERKLCQYYLVPEKKFSDEYLNTIHELASKMAYAYYTLNGDRAWGKEHNDFNTREKIFELLMRVQSVAELFLALYRLYEILIITDICFICHDHSSCRSRSSCVNCNRPIHVKCFQLIPIVKKSTSTQCGICQFRSREI